MVAGDQLLGSVAGCWVIHLLPTGIIEHVPRIGPVAKGKEGGEH